MAEAEAEGRHQPVHPTQPAPLLWHVRGAPLSTTARSGGRQSSSFMSALGGGGRRQQSQRRRRRRLGGHSRASPPYLRRVAAPLPRVLWRPMDHFCCPPPLPAPPLPPHSGCAECDATVARPTRTLLPHKPDTPITNKPTNHDHTQIHRRNTCTYMLNMVQHARGCIADGARSSFGPLTVLVANSQNARFGPGNGSKHHPTTKAARTRREIVTYSIILFHLRAFALARTCVFAP